jgi:phosphoribosyl-dephospho-CoA transferase
MHGKAYHIIQAWVKEREMKEKKHQVIKEQTGPEFLWILSAHRAELVLQLSIHEFHQR